MTRATVLLLTAGFVAGAAGDELVQREVSVLKLRPAFAATSAAVTLGDVLSFADADEQLQRELAGKPALAETPAGESIELSHGQVVARLGGLGVNMARVLVSGARVCRISIAASSEPVKPSEAAEPAPPLIKPAADGTRALADVLREYIARSVQSLGGELEIEFERAGQEFLELTTPPWSFRVRSASGDALGLRELSVSILRDGRVQRSVQIGVRVRLLKPVLVATRPLNIGAFVRREDVKLEPRLFERSEQIGLDQPDAAIGQHVKRFIEAGTMLTRADLKLVDLVQRSRPVAVQDESGAVALRLTGVALDSGGYGELVRVRLGESRKHARELRGVVTGPGTVRIQQYD